MNQILHWDCIDVMDWLISEWVNIDCIITDPSYSLPNNQFRPEARIQQRTFWEFSTYQSFFKQWVKKAKKLIKNDWDIYIFCDETFYAVLYPILYAEFYSTKMIIWDKERIGMWWLWRRQFEIIIHCRLQPAKEKSWDWDIVRCKPVRDKLHTSQKPVELIEKLIKKSTNEWDIVLDTMAWSWTTWIACQNTNRNYILIEIEEAYIDIIKARLSSNHK